MPELLKSQVARVLHMLTRVSSPSRRQVRGCLHLLRPLLLAAEASAEDVDRFEEAVLSALAEGGVLARLHCGPQVRETIIRVMEEELDLRMNGQGDLLSTRAAIDEMTGPRNGAARWCLKDLDNHTGRAATRAVSPAGDSAIPRGKRLPNLKPLNPRPLPLQPERQTRINRDDVNRMLRQLGFGGPDFGPEPPTGGSPARL